MLSDCLVDQLRLQIGIFVISALNELIILEKRAARVVFFWYLLFRVEDKQADFDTGLLPSFDLSDLLKHKLSKQHFISTLKHVYFLVRICIWLSMIVLFISLEIKMTNSNCTEFLLKNSWFHFSMNSTKLQST